MTCPFCSTNMRTSDREGVEVQYCPQCGGLWLQRGALESILARATASPGYAQGPAQDRESDDDDEDDRPNANRLPSKGARQGRAQDHDSDDDDDDWSDESRLPSKGGRQGRQGDNERRGGIGEFFGNLFNLD